MKSLCVTGGAGFIGSCFVRYMAERYPELTIVVLDKLTYAGNLENISSVKDRVSFVQGDIADRAIVENMFQDYGIDTLVNFAAETHVDRSISDAGDFVTTDVYGTYVLLDVARERGLETFVQISTDEVYGDIPKGKESVETDPLMPRNPYAASKAGADRMAYAFYATYGVPVIITRCSNNYGPYQYPEKMMPLFITNLLEGEKIPLYGDGQNIRDWIYVEDHIRAIDFLLQKGVHGEVYNISGNCCRTNKEITEHILNQLGKDESSIAYVEDRLGHDRRYALDASKLEALGFSLKYQLETALPETVAWYQENRPWWEKIKSGEYREYYKKMYRDRLSDA